MLILCYFSPQDKQMYLTFISFPLFTIGSWNTQNPIDGVGSCRVVGGGGYRRRGCAWYWRVGGGGDKKKLESPKKNMPVQCVLGCHTGLCWAALLPIVWTGVDRDDPSGDGWKGCWTFVRMILGNKGKADVTAALLWPLLLPGDSKLPLTMEILCD